MMSLVYQGCLVPYETINQLRSSSVTSISGPDFENWVGGYERLWHQFLHICVLFVKVPQRHISMVLFL